MTSQRNVAVGQTRYSDFTRHRHIRYKFLQIKSPANISATYTFKHPKIFKRSSIWRNVYATNSKSCESAATVQSAHETNKHTTIIAPNEKHPFEGGLSKKCIPDPPSKTFLVGNHVFSRNEAITCYLLYDRGVCVRELKEMYFPNATLEEIIVAIEVGDLIYLNFYNLIDVQMLDPRIFDPSHVQLSHWNVGELKRGRA